LCLFPFSRNEKHRCKEEIARKASRSLCRSQNLDAIARPAAARPQPAQAPSARPATTASGPASARGKSAASASAPAPASAPGSGPGSGSQARQNKQWDDGKPESILKKRPARSPRPQGQALSQRAEHSLLSQYGFGSLMVNPSSPASASADCADGGGEGEGEGDWQSLAISAALDAAEGDGGTAAMTASMQVHAPDARAPDSAQDRDRDRGMDRDRDRGMDRGRDRDPQTAAEGDADNSYMPYEKSISEVLAGKPAKMSLLGALGLGAQDADSLDAPLEELYLRELRMRMKKKL
jgi:hypothetical protein